MTGVLMQKKLSGNKRIIIAGGGTGGHFYPGFALAEHLRGQGWEVLFLVKEDDICIPRLKEAGYPYTEADLSSFPRTLNPLRQFRFLRRFAKGLLLTARCVKDYRPDAVLGTGSYVGTTAVLAAAMNGIPSFIHESNSVPGLGNRLAMRFCRKIMLGIPLKDGAYRGKTVLTGTPVRESFGTAIDKTEARKKLGIKKDKFTVLVFGGSQGADRLNMAILSSFIVLHGKMQFIHIAGTKNYQHIYDNYKNHRFIDSPDLLLSAYREDMPLLYSAADLVVCRAGASTIAELVQVEKPAILVPYPGAADNHQYYNARELDRAGACICLEETELFFKELELLLEACACGKKSVREMQAKYKEVKIPKGLESAAVAARVIGENI